MWSFRSLALFLSVFVVITFHSHAAKKEPTLGERVEQLTASTLSSKNYGIIKLNTDKFRQFVKQVPRNYSMVVMFTALSPQRGCGICGVASEEFSILSNSWRYSASFSNKLFFARVDFDDAPDVFNQMKLNTAPVFVHFPAKGKHKKVDTLDIERVGFSAESIGRWVTERTEIQIRVFRPPNYMGLLGLLLLLVFVVGLLYFRKNNLEFLYSSTTWGLAALTFVLVMTSGQMWNHIRGPPFIHKTREGAVAYIHGSSQGQFVVETYLVAMLYGCVTLGMILMTVAAKSKEDSSKRRIMALIGLGMVSIFFSLLLSVFRNKAGGYPYSFLFK